MENKRIIYQLLSLLLVGALAGQAFSQQANEAIDFDDDIGAEIDALEGDGASSSDSNFFEEATDSNVGEPLDFAEENLGSEDDAFLNDSTEEILEESSIGGGSKAQVGNAVEPEKSPVPQKAESEINTPALDANPTDVPSTLVTNPVTNKSFAATDSPDYEYEKRLHQIFRKHYAQPLSDSDWKIISGDRIIETYLIQKGDTLWDISNTFFGDGFYWTKVWSLNGGIQNPHDVEPGSKIQFQLGSLESPPTFFVGEGGGGQEPSEGGEAVFTESELVEIPPPLKEPKPVVMTLPPSLPGLNPKIPSEYDSKGLAKVVRKVYQIKNSVSLDYYISDEPAFGVGNILETEMGTKTAGPGHLIYVQSVPGAMKPGEVLRVIETLGKLEIPSDILSDDERGVAPEGYIIQVSGEIVVLEKVSSTHSDLETFRCRVKAAIRPINVGAKIVDGQLAQVNLDRKGEMVYIGGQIVGGAKALLRTLFSAGEIVFINKGKSDGMLPGYVLPITANRRLRQPGSKVYDDKRIKGHLKIVDVSERYSTAIIVDSREDVFSGDFVGSEVRVVLSEPGAPLSPQVLNDIESEDLDAPFDNAIDDVGIQNGEAVQKPVVSSPSLPNSAKDQVPSLEKDKPSNQDLDFQELADELSEKPPASNSAQGGEDSIELELEENLEEEFVDDFNDGDFTEGEESVVF